MRITFLFFGSFLFNAVVAQRTMDSLQLKVGQMLLMGLPDNKPDTGSQFYKDVKAGKTGGIILYERHLTATNSAENLKSLISFYRTDTHLELTDVSKTWKKEELVPYAALIKKGLVKAVMTAHIVNTQLDAASLPATLSSKMINGLLRGKMHFNGVVFSDDMQMKAISNEYGLKDAIEKAINAGVDILLFSGNIPGQSPLNGGDLVDIILTLVKEKKIAVATIDKAYQRIMKLKKEL